MKKIGLIFLLSLLVGFTPVFAATPDELKARIEETERILAEIGKQKDTLAKQISLMDSQMKLTSLKIFQTEVQIKTLEQEIEVLSGKIVRLDKSLDFLSRALLSRVAETYKRGKADFLLLLFSSKDFSEFISRYRYLQSVQIHDREVLLTMEQTRTSYDEQKQLKEKAQADLEKLQKQLEGQKKQLEVQTADRKRLLESTKGQEAVYQKLLADAKAELEAILGILEGRGDEKEIKKVNEGEKIAQVIEGSSCNSSGTHLHFMVVKDGKAENPFSFLRGGIDFENCSGSSCGSGDGDIFNPSGDWNWPLSPKIKLAQGYGYTWAVQHIPWLGGIYSFHNGIDIQGNSLEIKAIRRGTLYWGNFIGGCTLRYVRVHHEDGELDSYYLHVNY